MAGDTPFPGPLVTLRRRFESQKNAAFVVEFSSISVTAKRFSIPAQVATVVSLIAGMLGGLDVLMTFVPYGFADSIRSGTMKFFVSLGAIMLIPLGTAAGVLLGRSILRLWPQRSGVDLRVVSVDFGTFINSDALSAGGATLVEGRTRAFARPKGNRPRPRPWRGSRRARARIRVGDTARNTRRRPPLRRATRPRLRRKMAVALASRSGRARGFLPCIG